jgi:uncharacterized coiled-coil protein SlyX
MAGEFEKLEHRIKELEIKNDKRRNQDRVIGEIEAVHVSWEELEKLLKVWGPNVENFQAVLHLKSQMLGVEPRMKVLEARVTQIVAQLVESKKSAAGMADVKNALNKIAELDKRIKALESKVR